MTDMRQKSDKIKKRHSLRSRFARDKQTGTRATFSVMSNDQTGRIMIMVFGDSYIIINTLPANEHTQQHKQPICIARKSLANNKDNKKKRRLGKIFEPY